MVFQPIDVIYTFGYNFYTLEYTFKNSAREAEQTAVLGDYSLTIRSEGSERVIPYANITTVRLCKVNPTYYKIFIYEDSVKPLVITNHYFLADTGNTDRSRMYSTFVRVLHYHLKDKSGAIYSSGCSRIVLWKWGIFSIIPAFIFSFTIDYLGYGLINPYMLTLIITGVSAIAVFFLQFGQWPKEYNATDIPLNLLP